MAIVLFGTFQPLSYDFTCSAKRANELVHLFFDVSINHFMGGGVGNGFCRTGDG